MDSLKQTVLFYQFEFYDKEMGIPKDEITGFYKSPDGKLGLHQATMVFIIRMATPTI
jgi:hypothetical protein